ncbi:hypothetical protein [Streptomyces sp. NPDC058424]
MGEAIVDRLTRAGATVAYSARRPTARAPSRRSPTARAPATTRHAHR